jgi:hypothetical protein
VFPRKERRKTLRDKYMEREWNRKRHNGKHKKVRRKHEGKEEITR